MWGQYRSKYYTTKRIRVSFTLTSFSTSLYVVHATRWEYVAVGSWQSAYTCCHSQFAVLNSQLITFCASRALYVLETPLPVVYVLPLLASRPFGDLDLLSRPYVHSRSINSLLYQSSTISQVFDSTSMSHSLKLRAKPECRHLRLNLLWLM